MASVQPALVRRQLDYYQKTYYNNKALSGMVVPANREVGPVTEIAMQETAYGCLYVAVGLESQTAELLETIFPQIRVFAVKRIKHKQVNGVRSYETDILLPGYLIFTCPTDFVPNQMYRLRHVRRLLRYKNEEWQLQGEDREFAEWVVSFNGEIGLSKAVQEGANIRIVSGPLKDCEGKILKIDKHRRNCQVSLGFDRQLLKTWLAFDWLEPLRQRSEVKPTDLENQ